MFAIHCKPVWLLCKFYEVPLVANCSQYLIILILSLAAIPRKCLQLQQRFLLSLHVKSCQPTRWFKITGEIRKSSSGSKRGEDYFPQSLQVYTEYRKSGQHSKYWQIKTVGSVRSVQVGSSLLIGCNLLEAFLLCFERFHMAVKTQFFTLDTYVCMQMLRRNKIKVCPEKISLEIY